jgi:hypothetical protein
MNRDDFAINNFRKAVELQPGYVIAWNNLGDAYEKVCLQCYTCCAMETHHPLVIQEAQSYW